MIGTGPRAALSPGLGSAPAFYTARDKLGPALMRRLLHQASDDFDTRFGANHLWHGHRAFAVDESKLSTQRSNRLWFEFGGAEGAHKPQMIASTLFHVFSEVPYDIVMGPYASNEREHLIELLDRLRRGDVLVLENPHPRRADRPSHIPLRAITRSRTQRGERSPRVGGRAPGIVPRDSAPDRPSTRCADRPQAGVPHSRPAFLGTIRYAAVPSPSEQIGWPPRLVHHRRIRRQTEALQDRSRDSPFSDERQHLPPAAATVTAQHVAHERRRSLPQEASARCRLKDRLTHPTATHTAPRPPSPSSQGMSSIGSKLRVIASMPSAARPHTT
jgi:hypothetical protein